MMHYSESLMEAARLNSFTTSGATTKMATWNLTVRGEGKAAQVAACRVVVC